jgi:hypothetical protein
MSDYDDNHVIFRIEPVENRAKSISAGHPVYDDAEFVTITPPGGALVVDKAVDDVVRERYASRYEAWLKGKEEPTEGTSITLWPGATPATAQTLKAMAVHTVEALANANDAVLERIGPGARAMQQKAQAWLKGAEDIGKLAEQIAALTADNESLRERNRQLEQALVQVRERLDQPTQGRTPAVVQELRDMVA